MDGSLKRSRTSDDEDYSAQDAKKMRRCLIDDISNAELLEVLAERIAGNARLRAEVLFLLGVGEGMRNKDESSTNEPWDRTAPPRLFTPSFAGSTIGEGSITERTPVMSPPLLSPIFSPEFWDRVAEADCAVSPIQWPNLPSNNPLGHEVLSPPPCTPASPEYAPQSPTYSPRSTTPQPSSSIFEQFSGFDSILPQPQGSGDHESSLSPSWAPTSPTKRSSTPEKQRSASSGKRQKVSHASDPTEAVFVPVPDQMQDLFSHLSSLTAPGLLFGHVDQPYHFSLEASKKRPSEDATSSALHQAKKSRTSIIEQALLSTSSNPQSTQFLDFSSPSYTNAESPTTAFWAEVNPLSLLQTLPGELRAEIYSHLGLTTTITKRAISYQGRLRQAHCDIQQAWCNSWEAHNRRHGNPPAGTKAERVMKEAWKMEPAFEHENGPLIQSTKVKHHFRTGNARPGVVAYPKGAGDASDVDIKSVMALGATNKFFHDEMNKMLFDAATVLSVRIPDLENGLEDDDSIMDVLFGNMPWKHFAQTTRLTISFEEAQLYEIEWDKRTHLSGDKTLALLTEIRATVGYLKKKLTPRDVYILLPALQDKEKLDLTSLQGAIFGIKIGKIARELAEQIADWKVEQVTFGSLDSGLYRELMHEAGEKDMAECFEKVLRTWVGKRSGETSQIMNVTGSGMLDI